MLFQICSTTTNYTLFMTQKYPVSAYASLIYNMARYAYTLLLCCLLPIGLLLFKKKSNADVEPLENRSFLERFGKVGHLSKTGGIHIHCVSVGEINAASGLIHSLLEEYPYIPITLTTSSTTGGVHAYNMFKDRVSHNYLPVDIPLFINRFYKKLKPRLVLITEVEVWPNMLHVCTKRGVPVVLINARMTTKSLRRYRQFSWLFRPTFRQFSLICAQSSESFENFVAFGVYKNKLKLTRNMKFDLLPNLADEALGKQILSDYNLGARPILLAASTHDPEEKMLLNTYKHLKQRHQDLLLIMVPRHPHRFEDVNHLMRATGFNVARVSQSGKCVDKSSLPSVSSKAATQDAPEKQTEKPIDCLLVDTMGWLKACYSICTVTFVGGSFAPKGGHNALEAALYAKPIAMGPSTFNNPSICQHLALQNALMITHSEQALTEVFQHWLSRPQDATKDGERGLQVLLKNAGAVEYTMSILRPILDQKN